MRIEIDHTADEFHTALGITDDRADAIIKKAIELFDDTEKVTDGIARLLTFVGEDKQEVAFAMYAYATARSMRRASQQIKAGLIDMLIK